MTSYDVGQSDTYGAFQFNFRYSLHVSKSRQSDSRPNRDARAIRAKRPLVARPSRPAHRLGLYRNGAFYVAIGWNVDVQVGLPAGSTPITFCSASVVNVPFD
ncbi:hypothetical protein BQ8482_430036 [Mesorhizobium delmotii]|uniref:Uncharacterized protein n=1 Tax=Mesorhizobium delmotii TaxID=1631247 RepID=A0A2P9ATH6_9HYPH|nr:hypothetical protein BQ8482_430036 [Mesorhizobium delmotii]